MKSRLLLWATVDGAALYLASAVCLGTPPGADESGVQVAMWFREHRDSVRLYVWMLTVSAPLFALVFALLREFLPSPHRDVFLIGAVSFIATTAVQSGLPAWLGVFGMVAFGEQAVETITMFGSKGFTEPGGAMNLMLGTGLVAVWLVAFALWCSFRGTRSTFSAHERVVEVGIRS